MQNEIKKRIKELPEEKRKYFTKLFEAKRKNIRAFNNEVKRVSKLKKDQDTLQGLYKQSKDLIHSTQIELKDLQKDIKGGGKASEQLGKRIKRLNTKLNSYKSNYKNTHSRQRRNVLSLKEQIGKQGKSP